VIVENGEGPEIDESAPFVPNEDVSESAFTNLPPEPPPPTEIVYVAPAVTDNPVPVLIPPAPPAPE
jgi:hypothetical protein